MEFEHTDTHAVDALREKHTHALSAEAIEKLLANRLRRRLLSLMQQHEGPVAIDGLIERVTREESNAFPSDTPAELNERIATAVWETHLPLLADHDIVRYDKRSGMVRWWQNAGQLTNQLREYYD